jgi:hypothetical protein
MGRSATVFGLDVTAEFELPFLRDSAAAPTGRPLHIALSAGADESRSWPATAAIVCDQREPGGAINFRIETHPGAGFLIWGPRYGRHYLTADGRGVLCDPQSSSEIAWQRLLIAQVLPFAAALQGLEVFHASAVSTPAGAIALLGPSGAGKTTLAIELCRMGAVFLADDVVALERAGDGLLAHPGTPVAGLASGGEHERPRGGSAGPDPIRTGPIGRVLASDARECLVLMRGADAPAPLAALFLLERTGRPRGLPGAAPTPVSADGARFEALGDARELLSATFNSVLIDGERLHRLLDVCALAARGRVERIRRDVGSSPVELARAIAERALVSA